MHETETNTNNCEMNWWFVGFGPWHLEVEGDFHRSFLICVRRLGSGLQKHDTRSLSHSLVQLWFPSTWPTSPIVATSVALVRYSTLATHFRSESAVNPFHKVPSRELGSTSWSSLSTRMSLKHEQPDLIKSVIKLNIHVYVNAERPMLGKQPKAISIGRNNAKQTKKLQARHAFSCLRSSMVTALKSEQNYRRQIDWQRIAPPARSFSSANVLLGYRTRR